MITVLLSSYNGEKYLEEQLKSLLAQKGVSLQIVVRDDGSTDRTHEILEDYQRKGCLHWYTGENMKSAKSFLDLVYNAPDSEYYAFCDQDDYWEEDKLAIAQTQLDRLPSTIPALYYGRPRLVDHNLNAIPVPATSLHRMMDYYSSIITSNSGGCTMVFNRALLEKIKGKKPNYLEMHDTWVHKVCLIFGGNLIFDEDVHILYRQHGSNVLGTSNTWIKKWKEQMKKLRKKECIRSRTVRSLLYCYGDEMSPEHRQVSELVANYQNSIQDKLRLLFCPKIRTNYFMRNILFRISVLFSAF